MQLRSKCDCNSCKENSVPSNSSPDMSDDKKFELRVHEFCNDMTREELFAMSMIIEDKLEKLNRKKYER